MSELLHKLTDEEIEKRMLQLDIIVIGSCAEMKRIQDYIAKRC